MGSDGCPETDPAADSLRAFEAGELDALCVVDMFNEGLDVPGIDRIVLLRPTESRVVFLQQLGRGLRAMPGKPHLTVLDFVGNHRVFLHRILHLLSLRNGPAPLEALVLRQKRKFPLAYTQTMPADTLGR